MTIVMVNILSMDFSYPSSHPPFPVCLVKWLRYNVFNAETIADKKLK